MHHVHVYVPQSSELATFIVALHIYLCYLTVYAYSGKQDSVDSPAYVSEYAESKTVKNTQKIKLDIQVKMWKSLKSISMYCNQDNLKVPKQAIWMSVN